MTVLKFLEDSYMKEYESEVERVTVDGIILKETIFYPRGGGQNVDLGKVIVKDKEYEIDIYC